MKIILVLVLILIGFQQAFSKSIYVKVFNTDCANCYAGLYFLSNQYADLPYQFVFNQNLKRDKNELIEKYGFEKFKNYKLVFNDSLYNALETNYTSELIIIDNFDKVIYRDYLKTLDIPMMEKIWNAENPSPETIELKYNGMDTMPQLLNVKLSQNLLIGQTQYNKSYYYHAKNKAFKELKLTKKFALGCYKMMYGDSADYYYNTIQFMLVEQNMRMLRSNIDQVFITPNEELFFSSSIYIFTTKGNDTSLISVPLIAKYDLQKDSIHSIYLIPINNENNYYPSSDFFVYRDSLYIKLIYSEKNYIENAGKNNIFGKMSLQTPNPKKLDILNMYLPSNYKKYGMYSIFNDYTYCENVITHVIGNTFYDLVLGDSVKIPIEDSCFSDLYKIHSIPVQNIFKVLKFPTINSVGKLNETEYALLYQYRDITNYKRFDKEGNISFQKQMEIKSNTHTRLYHNNEYILYADEDNRVFLRYVYK